MREPACFSCEQEQRGNLPPRERIWVSDLWRVAHAFDSALPGWLVALPRRHVLAVAELTPAEAAELGPLLVGLSQASHEVTGCAKTYVMQFAEAEGFAHLHVHVVPRAADLPPELRGPRICTLLDAAEGDRVPDTDQDRLSERLTATISTFRPQ